MWLADRLRDAAMWPVNLVRDWPVRSGRLGQTIWQGIVGVVHLGPEAREAVQTGTFFPWLRQKPGRLAGWWHRCLSQFFDLVGGPEVAQFLMHLITHTTPLTPEEVATMRAILGPEGMRYQDVRVAEGGLFEGIFRLNGNLAFATWHTINLPRNGRHTRSRRDIVVHELAHVYQYERVGSRYLGEAIYVLIKTKRDCYRYGGVAGLQTAVGAGKQYRDFNREQQAQIIQDYYLLTQRQADVTAYTPFIDQIRSGKI